MLKKSDARVSAYITAVLKRNKALKESEVKAAVRRGLKLGRAPVGTGVIRQVRRKLGIDRPRALSYARKLLVKNPALPAKKVIEDVRGRFGISLVPPDVSHLRPADARRKKRTGVKVGARPAKKSQRSFGTVSITHETTGTPEEVARFFRSLASRPM